MPDPSTSLRAGPSTSPKAGLTGAGRACPACERRVPRNVATCRCGATLPPDTSSTHAVADAQEPESASRGVLNVLVGVLLLIGLAGSIYWVMRTPPSETAADRQVENTDRGAAAAGPSAATSAESPEARAWNAQANAKAIEPLSAPPDAPVPAPISNAPPGSVEEMIDHAMPAVVLVETSGGRGSGFFIARDTVITNVHVVENDAYVTLRKSDGSSTSARVASKAPAFDIAVLKIAQPSPSQVTIPMGSARALKPGQEIIVIGSALGTLQNTVSRGIVSALRTAGGATLVQTDAATNPGNSGGPMLDRNGSVIAITTMGYRGAQGLNFGVAIDHARDIVEGRQANLGSVGGGLSDIQSQAKAGSEADRRQQQGNEQLKAQVAQLVNAAQTIDSGWQRFRQQCFQTRINGSYDREWFAMLVPHALPSDAGAGCTGYYNAMDSDIKQFKGLMQRLMNEARQAGVLPGTVRDVLRQNRLDFDWER